MSGFTGTQGGLAQWPHGSTRMVNSLTSCLPSKSLATVWPLVQGQALAISYRSALDNFHRRSGTERSTQSREGVFVNERVV